ncbi:MAG: hypothetical protein P9X22_08975, partial [Candidatus Zapsychrus exili]|nr:hypothetical protein [Candidatus Zapsychrus exili]
ICILICVIFIVNNKINKSIYDIKGEKVETKKAVGSKGKLSLRADVKKKYERKWKETDSKELEKYGITKTNRVVEPSTAEEWQKYIEHNVEKFKIFEGEEPRKTIEHAQTTKQEYKKKVDKLNEYVDIVKDRIKKDPFNKKYQTQLQNLYRLKAIGNVLEQQGIVK